MFVNCRLQLHIDITLQRVSSRHKQRRRHVVKVTLTSSPAQRAGNVDLTVPSWGCYVRYDVLATAADDIFTSSLDKSANMIFPS